jgi:hypothetical protein
MDTDGDDGHGSALAEYLAATDLANSVVTPPYTPRGPVDKEPLSPFTASPTKPKAPDPPRPGTPNADPQVRKWRALFASVDADSSGSISSKEVGGLLRDKLGMDVDDDMLASVINEVDADSSGEIGAFLFPSRSVWTQPPVRPSAPTHHSFLPLPPPRRNG